MTSISDSPLLVDRIVADVERWPGVETEPHRFGGVEFSLGPREVGHVHRQGLVDINYPRRIRDALLDADETGEHHVVPDSGWTTFRVGTEADVERALRLLRISYLYLAATLSKTSRAPDDVREVDVADELDALDVSPAIRDAFDRIL